jgi:hypothetical protein
MTNRLSEILEMPIMPVFETQPLPPPPPLGTLSAARARKEMPSREFSALLSPSCLDLVFFMVFLSHKFEKLSSWKLLRKTTK